MKVGSKLSKAPRPLLQKYEKDNGTRGVNILAPLKSVATDGYASIYSINNELSQWIKSPAGDMKLELCLTS